MSKHSQLTESPVTDLPSFDEYRAALKYFLVNDLGMPALVAEEVLTIDTDFIERARLKSGNQEQSIAETADHLAFEPRKDVQWVRLEKGERKASKDQVVLDADGALGMYLDSLVKLGLHGRDRDSVATVMLTRGIECVLPLVGTKLLANK